MNLQLLTQLRRFSTSRVLRESFLSTNYKSEKLWNKRFDCGLLGGDQSVLKSINTKIISGKPLTNWEIDIFINIATPSQVETAQLQESARLLREIRSSLYAHTVLPSTHHAVCRLFLYSQRLPSLVNLLEKRVEYGIFPDFFIINILLNQAIDEENYMLASRLAAFVMFQEEFGENSITDKLSLLALSKYIESKTSFDDWKGHNNLSDPVFETRKEAEVSEQRENQEKKKEEDEEEEDEEDAEYVRVPFLRNPYFDSHFDLQDPRVICGKTMAMLGLSFKDSSHDIGARCSILGAILQGKWSEAVDLSEKLIEMKTDLGPTKELAKYYVENLHEIEEPEGSQKSTLLSNIDSLSGSESQSLSELAQLQCKNMLKNEQDDINQLEDNFKRWSEARIAVKEREKELLLRKELKAEIEAKKEELRLKEQYLYFYDNLKKSRATRIEYD